MNISKVRVKIMDVTSSFVSFNYLSSNARSRVRRKKFINDFQQGKIDVVNPELLDESK